MCRKAWTTPEKKALKGFFGQTILTKGPTLFKSNQRSQNRTFSLAKKDGTTNKNIHQ